jgi:hypothetical protein
MIAWTNTGRALAVTVGVLLAALAVGTHAAESAPAADKGTNAGANGDGAANAEKAAKSDKGTKADKPAKATKGANTDKAAKADKGAKPAAAGSVQQLCAGKSYFAREWCESKACFQSAYQYDPLCVRRREAPARPNP